MYTPANKRFVPAPGTGRHTDSEKSQRSTQSGRFTSTSHISSSPFMKTPFASRRRVQDNDEIDTSFGDDGNTSTAAIPVTRNRGLSTYSDNIEDVSQESSTNYGEGPAEEIIADATDYLPVSTDYQSTSATKRRKLSQSQGYSSDLLNYDRPQQPRNTADVLSSFRDEVSNDGFEEDIRESKEQATPSSPDIDLRTPQRTSRFRVNPSTTATVPLGSKATFQAALTSAQRGPQPMLESTLPDAFSPSRRKGAREYVRGGMAATVRSWVLDLAAEESQFSYDQKTSTILRVISAVIDPSGRYAEIVDQERQNWLLIEEQQIRGNSKQHSRSKVEFIRPGMRIELRGGPNSTWKLPLPSNNLDNKGTSPVLYQVAVIWSILK